MGKEARGMTENDLKEIKTWRDLCDALRGHGFDKTAQWIEPPPPRRVDVSPSDAPATLACAPVGRRPSIRGWATGHLGRRMLWSRSELAERRT